MATKTRYARAAASSAHETLYRSQRERERERERYIYIHREREVGVGEKNEQLGTAIHGRSQSPTSRVGVQQ